MANQFTLIEAKDTEYPYPKPPTTIEIHDDDAYNRDPLRLMDSLATFSRMGSIGEIDLSDEFPPNTLQHVTRFCRNQISPEDMSSLLCTYKPIIVGTGHRHIYNSQILELGTRSILGMITNIQNYECCIFPHGLATGDWIIFLFFPDPRIEVFIVGKVDDVLLQRLTKTLFNLVRVFYPIREIPCSIRKRFSRDQYLVDSGSFVFFIHYLYLYGNYLDLDTDLIRRYKVGVLSRSYWEHRNLVLHHDKWLGQLRPQPSDNPWHPFVESVGDNEFPILNQHGWVVFDVDGDGNCGFYCLILGLENNGVFSYSVSQRDAPTNPMITNKPWQFSVMRLRHHLKKESDILTSKVYDDNVVNLPWFPHTTADNLEEFRNLGQWFIADKLKQNDYFNRTHLTKLNSEWMSYQMNPYWTSYVFSYSFKMRVIVYTRNSELELEEKPKKTAKDNPKKKPKKKKPRLLKRLYRWCTHIMDHSAPIESRIDVKEGLHRLSDKEFRRRPTVELI